MARLGYAHDSLYPVLILGEGELDAFNHLMERCRGNSREDLPMVEWFNGPQYKAGVLEMGGLHCLRAIRQYGGIGIAKEVNQNTLTVALPGEEIDTTPEKHPHINDGVEPYDRDEEIPGENND